MLRELIYSIPLIQLHYILIWLNRTQGVESPLKNEYFMRNLTSIQLATVEYMRKEYARTLYLKGDCDE